ncbi:MAG: NAD-dependent epimerase [Bacteroidia bacterium]
MPKILITGTAGFIGFHLAQKLIADTNFEIISVDGINDYYEVSLKTGRLKALGFNTDNISYGKFLSSGPRHKFIQLNLEDKDGMEKLFHEQQFDYVVNLAAQAGVRYSLQNPRAYVQSNIDGFINILEGCRHNKVRHLVYASSSSVYGLNTSQPFSVSNSVDHPISMYAATKKSNELMAHTYSYLYDIPTTGLRFFTVYGPWGRPDMALFLFTKNILEEKPIQVFNNGNMKRDFTYVLDIVEALKRLLLIIPQGDPSFNTTAPDPSRSTAPYKVFNIGNNSPVELMHFIRCIEEVAGKEATINYMPIQPGDVPETYADVKSLYAAIDFKPGTPVLEGIKAFVNWYRDYYKV